MSEKLQVLNIGKNKTQVSKNDIVVYVSYKTPVAAMVNGVPFRTEEFHSVTTSRHIRLWLESFDISKDDAAKKEQKYFDNLLDEMGVNL